MGISWDHQILPKCGRMACGAAGRRSSTQGRSSLGQYRARRTVLMETAYFLAAVQVTFWPSSFGRSQRMGIIHSKFFSTTVFHSSGASHPGKQDWENKWSFLWLLCALCAHRHSEHHHVKAFHPFVFHVLLSCIESRGR